MTNNAPGIPRLLRVFLIFSGSVAVTLLVIAATLDPNPRGVGTHRQLGLPPCSFKVLVGIRCPACGMTTSWAHMVRGQVLRSFAANTGGALLAILSLTVGPWALASGLRGNWLWRSPTENLALAVVLTISGVTIVDWLVRLMG